MKLKIRAVDFIYDETENVTTTSLRFDVHEEDFQLNGNIKIAKEEYDANATDLIALGDLAMTKLSGKITTI